MGVPRMQLFAALFCAWLAAVLIVLLTTPIDPGSDRTLYR